MKNILLSWSSGKDSAWALHVLRQRPDVRVTALFTTFNSAADRVAMHAVRRSLVQAQAEAASLSLWTVELPWPCTNLEYEELIQPVFKRAAEEGINAVAFGDLFLDDVRAYREQQLVDTGLNALFPLWHYLRERSRKKCLKQACGRRLPASIPANWIAHLLAVTSIVIP